MNGVTGRMGTNQHLVRSIVAIRKQGGVAAQERRPRHARPDPGRPQRGEARSARQGARHRALDHQPRQGARRQERHRVLRRRHHPDAARRCVAKAIDAGKHIYCEKPVATNLEEALAHRAQGQGRRHQARRGAGQAVPARPAQAQAADRLRASSAACSSVRGEFGYWVFEGDLQPAQRPSWNYRAEDGGGIILDMLCHWRYVLDNTFGNVKSVSCLGATHIPERIDESGKRYKATADDAAYATFQLDGGVIAHFNMLVGDARAPRRPAHPARRRHARLGRGRPAGCRHPAAHGDAEAGLEPRRQAADRFLRGLAAGAGDAGLRQRLQAAVGSLHPPRRARTRPTNGTCSKAPRACSSSSARCGAGRSAAGWMCRS